MKMFDYGFGFGLIVVYIVALGIGTFIGYLIMRTAVHQGLMRFVRELGLDRRTVDALVDRLTGRGSEALSGSEEPATVSGYPEVCPNCGQKAPKSPVAIDAIQCRKCGHKFKEG